MSIMDDYVSGVYINIQKSSSSTAKQYYIYICIVNIEIYKYITNSTQNIKLNSVI
jgi:hypothetical protein